MFYFMFIVKRIFIVSFNIKSLKYFSKLFCTITLLVPTYRYIMQNELRKRIKSLFIERIDSYMIASLIVN